MIDFLIAAVAALLVLLGLAIIAGPSLPRLLRTLLDLARRVPETRTSVPAAAIRRRPAQKPPPPRRPLREQVAAATGRLSALLKQERPELAARLDSVTHRLAEDESGGLRQLLPLLRRLEAVRLRDEAAQAAFDATLGQLRRAATERAEQLELLPFLR